MFLLRKISVLLILISISYLVHASPEKQLRIVYPEDERYNPETHVNIRYMRKMLKLALKKSGYTYEILSVPISTISENRSHLYLKEKRYNVHWMMTSKFHEKELIPVRIPLYKGLIGWRLLFIKATEEGLFARISNIEELKVLRAGLGHDWPDVGIMKNSGFKISPLFSADGRYNFLNLGRCDYFPRSITEIWNEHESAQENNIIVEKTIALHYSAAYYFFVAPGETEIANAITRGLHNAIRDGEFEKIFIERFHIDITKSNLKKRKLFKISNPLFDKTNVAAREQLWFQPNNY